MTDKKDHPQLGKNKACQSHVGRYPDLFWCQSSAQGCRMFFHQLKPIKKGLGTWLGEQSVCSTTWVQSLESTWKRWVWWCAIITLTLVQKGHGDLWGSLVSWPRLMSKSPSYWDTTSQKWGVSCLKDWHLRLICDLHLLGHVHAQFPPSRHTCTHMSMCTCAFAYTYTQIHTHTCKRNKIHFLKAFEW